MREGGREGRKGRGKEEDDSEGGRELRIKRDKLEG